MREDREEDRWPPTRVRSAGHDRTTATACATSSRESVPPTSTPIRAPRSSRSRPAGTLLAGVPMSFMGMLTGAFPLYFGGARQPHHRRGRPHLRRLLPRRHRSHDRPLARGRHGRDRRAPPRQGRHHHDAPHGGRRLRRRRAPAPLRPALLAVLADGDRRQPLGAAHVPHGCRSGPTCSSSASATTAPWTRRSSSSARTASRWPSQATSARRWIRRRPPGSSSSTTSRPCAPRSRRATWPPCSWSRG